MKGVGELRWWNLGFDCSGQWLVISGQADLSFESLTTDHQPPTTDHQPLTTVSLLLPFLRPFPAFS